jgi:hypothetical protein
MAINVLGSLRDPFDPVQITPPVQLSGMTSAGMNNAIAPMMQPPSNMNAMAPRNALPRVMNPQPEPQRNAQPEQRGRPKWAQVVGRIGDVMAMMGGVQPLYSMFTEQERAAEEEAMRQQALQMFTANPQDETAFQGLIAAGVDPREAIQLRAAMTPQGAEPIRIGSGDRLVVPDGQGGFREVISPDPAARQGTLPREVQIANLLEERAGPEAAKRYLENLAGSQGMTEYQRAMIGVRLQELDLRERTAANRPPSASEARAATVATAGAAELEDTLGVVGEFVSGMRNAGQRLFQAGGIAGRGSTPVQSATAAVLENVPFVERVTNQPSFEARQDIQTLVGQTLPRLVAFMGGLNIGGKNLDAAKELEYWQNTFSGVKDFGTFQRTMQRFENRIEQRRRQMSQPSTPPARAGDQAAPRRNMNAPTRAPSAPTVFRRNPQTGRLEGVR